MIQNLIFGCYSITSDILAESLKANKNCKKITHFTTQLCSKYLTYFKNLNSLNIVKI